MKKPPFAKRCAITALAFLVQLHCCALSAWANPSDPTVVSGQASFSGLGTSNLNITNTPGAIINWQTFSIGQNEITRFIQQSSQSAVLNRVMGGQMSELLGRLQSNGQVFLINPNGILVGPNAAIDTAGFFASTLQMLDADFAAGRLKLQGDSSAGSIQNQGWIRTGYGGFVVLVAPNVENSGLIQAPGGNILLAAGQKVIITSLDVDGVQFEIQAPDDTVINLGKLLADDGAVGIFAGTLQHSGIIRANALTRDEAGEIVLRASDSVEITASGSVHADGATGGDITIEAVNGTARVAGKVAALGRDGVGGNVDVLGNKVSLAEHALIDVSGTDGGGQIRVGGDYQGANPDVQNAESAYVGEDVTLKADATESGDGGRIIVWADGYTRYFASLSARGGPDGGNGGFAEVSGAGDLLFVGGADLGAPNGELGTLLLDPLDLFVDALGGINPYLFDELTDVPFNSVTVSPATLAAITGNVILYASRDLRINSAITLTGTGQGLAAEAGRDLQLGASITTSGGAVSLTALGTTSGGTLSTFASSTIDTSGGAVTLNAKTISAGLLGISAGTGAVNATSSAGSLSLGSIASAGATSLTSMAGSLSTGSIVSGSTLSLSSTGGGISTGALTAGGNTSLTSAFGISTGGILTNGGTLNATASNGGIFVSSTIDTRPGQAGATGGAVTMSSTDSSTFSGSAAVNTRAINTGNANVTLSGENITTNGFAIDTTGNVTLTAATTDSFANSSIAAKINNAASVTASATLGSNSNNSASVNLSSDTDLNATTVTATTAGCLNYSSCPGANITLSAIGDVNVGTVTATSTPTFQNSTLYGVTYADPRYENLNETVNVSSSAGSILAMSGTSLITANDVTLSTIPGTLVATDGGIGTVGTAVRVAVDRNFILKSNGDFNVDLIGTGPNRLDVQLGVATTGQSYSGTLDGTGLNLDVSADDATVTVDLFDVTSGFDQRVFNQSPLISIYAVNGNMSVTDANLPAGDNTGSSTPAALYNCATFGGFFCPAAISYEALPVTLRAKGDLEIVNYMRTLGAQAKTTTFQSDDGSVTLATIDAARDAVSVFADTGILLTDNLTTLGNVSMTNNVSGDIEIGDTNGDELVSNGSVTLTNWGGDVAIVRIDTTGGSGNVTINATSGAATVRAALDNAGVEISSAGAIAISSNTIGDSTFTNPLDLAGNAVSLTTFGSDGGTLGDIGFSGAPVIANTTELSINASANFNVDTGSVDLQYLTVTADPAGVGNLGLAEVTTDGTTYEFVTDGTDFTLGDYTAPADQFDDGQLRFTATTGNVTINSIDFSASDGSFWVQTNGNLASITQMVGETIDLGTGIFTLRADGDVTLEAVNAGGLSASNATSNFGSGCLYIYYYSCGVQTFTANQTLTDSAWQAGTGGGGYWDVTSRGAIVTGDLDVGAVYFYNYSGGITTGTIGTAAAEASDVTLYAEYPYDAVVTDAIEADSLYLNGSTITVNGDINAVNTDADSVSLYAETDITTGDVNAGSVYVQAGGVLTFGDINATADDPSSITMLIYSSSATVTTGSLDADSIYIANYFISTRPETITINGGIGDNSPGTDVTLYAGGISINGDVTLDSGSAGNIDLRADNAELEILGGDISAGDGSTIMLIAESNSLPFEFDTIDAGATGSVTISTWAGILQTLAGGSGGGITAETVDLSAIAFTGGNIEGTSPLYLYDTTNLRIQTTGDVDILLDGTVLESLTIYRHDSTASWSLAGFAGGQSLALTTTGSGVDIDLSSSTALDFTYYNFDGALGDIENASGIDTGGGWLDLYASGDLSNAGGIVTQGGSIDLYASGALDTGAIDSGDGSVFMQAGSGGIFVSDDVNAGIGSITAYADTIQNNAGAQLISSSSVEVDAWGGDLGTSGTPLEIVAPTTLLYSTGDAWADLTGTNNLTIVADNGFDVTSDTDLTHLYLHTDAPGMGPVDLVTVTQTFDFDRDSFITPTTFLVHGIDSATPLTSLTINITGDVTIDGSIDANALTVSGGILTLDGSGSALSLSNVSQLFSANDIVIAGEVNADASTSQSLSAVMSIDFTGFGGLSAGTSQNISTSSSGTAITFQADGGAIDLSAASQTISGGSATTISFLGGDAAGESVMVSASSTQNINTHDNIASNIVIEGGSGADSSVSIVYSGTGTQFVQGGNIAITGGAGTDAHAEITTASGAQRIRATGDIVLTGGDASGAEARIVSTSTLEQRIGETQFIPFVGPEPYQTDNIILQGGNGAGALISATDGVQKIQANIDLRLLGGDGVDGSARIVKTGTANDQRIGCQSYWFFENCNQNLNSLILTAGTNGAFAELETASTQYIYATSSMSLTGSADDAGYALIEKAGASGSQNIYGGTTTMTAGAGDGSDVSLVSGTSQSLVFSGLTMNAGGTAGTDTAIARIEAAGSQSLSASTTTLNGGAGDDSTASIESTGGSQNLFFSSLSMTGGSGANADAFLRSSTTQTLDGGNFTLIGGTGAGSESFIDAGTTQFFNFIGSLSLTGGNAAGASAWIEGDSQQVFATAINLTGGTGTSGNASDALIVNRSGNQIVQGSGAMTLTGGADYSTVAIRNEAAGGTQTIQASSMTLQTQAGANNATNVAIENLAATAQTVNATSSGIRLVNDHSDGTVKIQSAATQDFNAAFLDISTGAGSDGDAAVIAAGDQEVHTFNGLLNADGSLRVVALGGGSASLTSGGVQLLEIDYPELMQATRDGRITVGDAAALGASSISAVDQHIFAKSIAVLGGSAPGSDSEISASDEQYISTLRGGLDVIGGAGGNAAIDPLIQVIVINGDANIQGGSGSGVTGSILSDGGQVILNTLGDINVSGGSGTNSFGQIITTGFTQTIGSVGNINLVPGSGTNADAIIAVGSGSGQSFLACLNCTSGFLPTLTSNPFSNTSNQFGVFGNPFFVTLADLSTAPGGPSTFDIFFDFAGQLLAFLEDSDELLDELEEDGIDLLDLRRMKICR